MTHNAGCHTVMCVFIKGKYRIQYIIEAPGSGFNSRPLHVGTVVENWQWNRFLSVT
jgi:hypothetical protein